MADNLSQKPPKPGEKTKLTNAINRTTSETMRLGEPEKNVSHPTSLASTTSSQRKKTPAFQITSVTVGPRISNDGGDDSADDLDESHTDDFSDVIDTSRITDIENETPSFSEDTFSKEDVFFNATAASLGTAPVIPTSSQYGLAIVATEAEVNNPSAAVTSASSVGSCGDVHVNVTESGNVINIVSGAKQNESEMRDVHAHTGRNERFKVVKIESTEPFKRGRWMCMDYLDHTMQQQQQSQQAIIVRPTESSADTGSVQYAGADSGVVITDNIHHGGEDQYSADQQHVMTNTGTGQSMPVNYTNISPGQTLQQVSMTIANNQQQIIQQGIMTDPNNPHSVSQNIQIVSQGQAMVIPQHQSMSQVAMQQTVSTQPQVVLHQSLPPQQIQQAMAAAAAANMQKLQQQVLPQQIPPQNYVPQQYDQSNMMGTTPGMQQLPTQQYYAATSIGVPVSGIQLIPQTSISVQTQANPSSTSVHTMPTMVVTSQANLQQPISSIPIQVSTHQIPVGVSLANTTAGVPLPVTMTQTLPLQQMTVPTQGQIITPQQLTPQQQQQIQQQLLAQQQQQQMHQKLPSQSQMVPPQQMSVPPGIQASQQVSQQQMGSSVPQQQVSQQQMGSSVPQQQISQQQMGSSVPQQQQVSQQQMGSSVPQQQQVSQQQMGSSVPPQQQQMNNQAPHQITQQIPQQQQSMTIQTPQQMSQPQIQQSMNTPTQQQQPQIVSKPQQMSLPAQQQQQQSVSASSSQGMSQQIASTSAANMPQQTSASSMPQVHRQLPLLPNQQHVVQPISVESVVSSAAVFSTSITSGPNQTFAPMATASSVTPSMATVNPVTSGGSVGKVLGGSQSVANNVFDPNTGNVIGTVNNPSSKEELTSSNVLVESLQDAVGSVVAEEVPAAAGGPTGSGDDAESFTGLARALATSSGGRPVSRPRDLDCGDGIEPEDSSSDTSPPTVALLPPSCSNTLSVPSPGAQQVPNSSRATSPVPPSASDTDKHSASGTSAVAIDNKIEQAMDLVKSHLMFAVREEVEVLKEKIAELMDRINQLELENTILKAHASQETLAQLGGNTPQQQQQQQQQQGNKNQTTQPPTNGSVS